MSSLRSITRRHCWLFPLRVYDLLLILPYVFVFLFLVGFFFTFYSLDVFWGKRGIRIQIEKFIIFFKFRPWVSSIASDSLYTNFSPNTNYYIFLLFLYSCYNVLVLQIQNVFQKEKKICAFFLPVATHYSFVKNTHIDFIFCIQATSKEFSKTFASLLHSHLVKFIEFFFSLLVGELK